MTPREWLEAYRRAWEEADVEAAVALFTEDAVYRSSPFREPSVGRDGIRSYWAGATAGQEATRVRIGEPIVAGNRVAAEWWTTMRDEGEEITLPGCLVLRFAPDGRCEELREYWHVEAGHREPPASWGT
jgi:ketosteroid isomerase-like protein